MATSIQASYAQGEMNTELAGFFKGLLEKGVVDALLLPVKQPPHGVMQTLITNPASLEHIDPFAPVVPLNSAKLVSSLSAVPPVQKIGVVLRSCEVRAVVELVKLKQANTDNLLIITMDCLGRYENNDFRTYAKEGGTSEQFISNALDGNTSSNGFDIVDACKICEFPNVSNTDLRMGPLGAGKNSFIIESVSDKGEQALQQVEMECKDVPSARKDGIEKLAAKRGAARDALFAEYNEQTNSFELLEEKLAGCINCYNCRVACPVCYCKECVFVTDTFRHKGEQYIAWAQNSDGLKMPTDTLFYHLTRMTHIATFCVGCGQCTSACPNDIDLMPIFRTSAQATQNRFNYEAGRDVNEKQPLAVFESDELVEITGQVK